MKPIKFLFLLLISTGVVLWTSCEEDESPEGPASMTVKLTDAPADLDGVFVDIQAVQVHYADIDNEDDPRIDSEGWILLETNAGIYNLLELRDGVTVVLADGEEIPKGKIGQMRLVLGDENFIVLAGVTIDVKVPSAQNTGIKINLNQEIEAEANYEIVLDFDAEKSVIAEGNGGYTLKPVIKLESVSKL